MLEMCKPLSLKTHHEIMPLQ